MLVPSGQSVFPRLQFLVPWMYPFVLMATLKLAVPALLQCWVGALTPRTSTLVPMATPLASPGTKANPLAHSSDMLLHGLWYNYKHMGLTLVQLLNLPVSARGLRSTRLLSKSNATLSDWARDGLKGPASASPPTPRYLPRRAKKN